jgi:hypothetical protein
MMVVARMIPIIVAVLAVCSRAQVDDVVLVSATSNSTP